MKWEKVKLGELYEVHNGLSKAGKFFGEGYPFLTFSTVFNPVNRKGTGVLLNSERRCFCYKNK